MSAPLNGPIQPWYGSWPPELNREANMKLHKFDIPLWVIMVVILVLSLLGWVATDHAMETYEGLLLEMLRRLCEALAIASILGATIDGFLKMEIAKNVFEASLGYLLPEELKPELKWIYDQKIMCIESKQECHIKHLGNDKVELIIKTNRRFRNFSESSTYFKYGVAVDLGDEITEFGYRIGEQEPLKDKSLQHKENIPEMDIKLRGNQEIETWNTVTIRKHSRDQEPIVFSRYPTKNPSVSVWCEDGIKHELIMYYGRDPKARKKLGENTTQLTGVLLPVQLILLKWWKDEAKN